MGRWYSSLLPEQLWYLAIANPVDGVSSAGGSAFQANTFRCCKTFPFGPFARLLNCPFESVCIPYMNTAQDRCGSPWIGPIVMVPNFWVITSNEIPKRDFPEPVFLRALGLNQIVFRCWNHISTMVTKFHKLRFTSIRSSALPLCPSTEKSKKNCFYKRNKKKWKVTFLYRKCRQFPENCYLCYPYFPKTCKWKL